MIKSKEDYLYYLECDRIALIRVTRRPRSLADPIWRFERLMRKREYIENTKSGIWRLYALWLHIRFNRMSIKLGFSLPINFAGPGLAIPHYGTIVVNDTVKMGSNCKIHTGVNIGANRGDEQGPQIGDNVYIGPGAKLIGNISIASNVVIGANAVVTKSILDEHVTYAGVPAKKISDNGSEKHLICATEIVEAQRKIKEKND